jgi:hypothetical protein
MNCEIKPLEKKREELAVKVASAKIIKDYVAVNKLSSMLCQCDEMLAKARAGDESGAANNPPTTPVMRSNSTKRNHLEN